MNLVLIIFAAICFLGAARTEYVVTLVVGKPHMGFERVMQHYGVSGETTEDAVAMAAGMAAADGWKMDFLYKVETSNRAREDDETTTAIEALTNPVETITTVIVPAEVWVQVESAIDGSETRVMKVTVLPKEADAGYFGVKSYVWDGPPIDLSQTGEFWLAMAEYLMSQNLPDGEFIATWEG